MVEICLGRAMVETNMKDKELLEAKFMVKSAW